MHYPVRVQVAQTFEYLLHYAFDMLLLQNDRNVLSLGGINLLVGMSENKLIEIDRPILQSVVEQILDVKYIMQFHDVDMIQFLKQFDLPKQGELESIQRADILLLLDRHQMLCFFLLLLALIDHLLVYLFTELVILRHKCVINR